MSNSIAISPEQFIFAQDQELKTTSLKVAQAFGKEHKNILRDIDKILLQVSDSFGKLNFEPTEYEQKNNLGLMVKIRMFNVTKDGFMFLVMGFTGKKAASIKEAYINAFNLMHEKLFPVRNALVELPTLTPKQQRHAQDRVREIVNSQDWATYSIVWGSVKKEFDVGTYKDIKASKYPDLCEFLKCEPLEGELMPIEHTFTNEKAIDQLKGDGYIVVRASKHGFEKMVMEFVPQSLFADLVEVVGGRMKAINFATD